MSAPSNQAPCSCTFSSPAEKGKTLAQFIKAYGDDVPEATIKEATSPSKLGTWQMICDCADAKRIVSAGHYEKNDWYLCTVKHLATHSDFRGRGLGAKIASDVVQKAFKTGCVVLAADITTTNTPSLRIFDRLGFERVNTFCWQKGETPANILHFVKMPPKNGVCY